MVVVLPASTWAKIPIFLYRLKSVMVLSLTLEGRGGVKTARSYPLLALESSFSARFSLYRTKALYPIGPMHVEQDVNTKRTGITRFVITRAFRLCKRLLRRPDALLNGCACIGRGTLAKRSWPEQMVRALPMGSDSRAGTAQLNYLRMLRTDGCAPSAS